MRHYYLCNTESNSSQSETDFTLPFAEQNEYVLQLAKYCNFQAKKKASLIHTYPYQNKRLDPISLKNVMSFVKDCQHM